MALVLLLVCTYSNVCDCFGVAHLNTLPFVTLLVTIIDQRIGLCKHWVPSVNSDTRF